MATQRIGAPGKLNNDSQDKVFILVVDDEPMLRTLNSHILSSQGYGVFEASSGQQALNILSEHKIDLVMSDVYMPDMNGYELAEEINQQYPDVAIQLVSGCADEQPQSELAERLNAELLQKPFPSSKLLEYVRRRLVE